nr:MAG TPA: hypothetical protein [Inoviridae sp.]
MCIFFNNFNLLIFPLDFCKRTVYFCIVTKTAT